MFEHALDAGVHFFFFDELAPLSRCNPAIHCGEKIVVAQVYPVGF